MASIRMAPAVTQGLTALQELRKQHNLNEVLENVAQAVTPTQRNNVFLGWLLGIAMEPPKLGTKAVGIFVLAAHTLDQAIAAVGYVTLSVSIVATAIRSSKAGNLATL